MEVPQPCKPDDDDNLSRWMIIVSVVFGSWFVFSAIVIFRGGGGAEEIARFGDSFGMINAGFSSLAAAGAVYAVILQSRELKAARDDARQNREDSARSITAQEDSVKLQARIMMYQELMTTRQSNRQHLHKLREKLKDTETRMKNPGTASDQRLPGMKNDLTVRIAAMEDWLQQNQRLMEALRAAISRAVDLEIEDALDEEL